jgi:murein DD-endopeptidase MepM/ murein hydrolase activator NlpD
MEQLLEIAHTLREIADLLEQLAQPPPPEAWMFPVGTDEFPPKTWYCAQYHTYPNPPPGVYNHTGIDLNLDISPWGDIDRGQPVFSIANGTVHDRGYSDGWVGVVVIRVTHDGAPMWFRYAHLDSASITVQPGDPVTAGQHLGDIGDYTRGAAADHLHFDCAIDPFGWPYYRTAWIRWLDPVPILKAHLDPATIDAMLARR